MGRRARIAEHLRALAPLADDRDLAAVLDHALHSRGLRPAAPPTAAWLSLVTWIRHNLTDYDDLLAEGYGAEAARHFCREQINEALTTWGCRRRLGDDP